MAFVKWPNDKEGKTSTIVLWIIAGFVMVLLTIGAVIVMSNVNVQQAATVE